MSRGIALLFHDRGTRRGEWSAARPGTLYARKRPGTHFTGSWVGPRADLEGGKSHIHRYSIPDPPARSSVHITTELPGTHQVKYMSLISPIFTKLEVSLSY